MLQVVIKGELKLQKEAKKIFKQKESEENWMKIKRLEKMEK